VKDALSAAYHYGAKNRTDAPPATQATHTQGIWYVDGQADNETQLWIRTFHRPIASIRIGKEPDIDKANARLIAAAPKLLSACQMLLVRLEGSKDLPRGSVYDFATATIAEATVSTGDRRPL
jgi:hypothetical protein